MRCLANYADLPAPVYFPSSIDRSRAASTASVDQLRQPVLAHQHSERRGGGAVRAGHLLAQPPGSSRLSAASEAAP